MGNGTGGAGAVADGTNGWAANFGFGFSANNLASPALYIRSNYIQPTGGLGSTDGNLRVAVSNSLTKTGTGTLTLSGVNTFTGSTTVNGGSLVLAGGAAIANNADVVTIADGATLQLFTSETISAFSGAPTSTLALGANTLTVNTGNVTVGNVTTANGGINAVAGAIVDNNAAAMNITGTGIVLQSSSGVGTAADPLEGTISAVEAAGGTGGVFLNNTGNLTIGGLSAMVGLSAAGGDVAVTTAGNISITENVTTTGAGNDVLLTGTDLAAAGQDIVVSGGVTISAGGVITLTAGDNATVPATALLVATGNVAINIDAGDADPGVGGSLVFDGDVDAPLAIFTGSADVGAGSPGNSFNVRPDQDPVGPRTPIEVFGLAPTSGVYPAADQLVVDINGLGTPTLTLGPGDLNGSFSFGALAASLTYNNIEDISSDPPGSTFHLVLDMQFSGYQNGVADTILAQLNAAGTSLELLVNAAPVFSGADASIESLTIIGSSDNDALTIQETAGGLPRFASGAPAVDNSGIGGGVSAGSHLNASADLAFETLVPGPWDATDVTIHFDGGAAGNDSLTLNQTNAGATGYFSDTSDAGNSGNLTSTNQAWLLSFANVEPLVLSGSGGSLMTDATGTPGTANLTITDIGAASQIVGDGGFAATTFSGFSDVLVAGGGGSETIDLVSVDAAVLTQIRLAGGNTNDVFALPGGDTAADTLRLQTLPATTQALLVGHAGNDSFLLSDGGSSVDFIAGNVTVDGTDGNLGGNTDTLTIVNTGGTTVDNAIIGAVDAANSQDYFIDGVTAAVSTDVVFRNLDVLNYTGTALDDSIDARLVNTVPQHDLSTLNLSGWTGADQFLLYDSNQRGGSGTFAPTGVPSGVSNVNLYGDAPGNPNAGDGNDTFGQSPIGITGTGATDVGLASPDTTRMIRPSISTAIAVDGGQPTGLAAPLGDATGDVMNVDISALPTTSAVIVSTFSPGTVVAPGLIQPLTWTQIEDINLVDQALLTNVQMGDLFARATPNADLVQITRNPTTANPNQIRLRITGSIGNYSASNKTIIYGGAGNDTLTQSNLTIPAEFYGEAGDDYLSGAMNNDWLVGGADNDRINGSGGDNILWGDNAPTSGDQNPQDSATGGNDQLSGLGGSDVFYGSGGNDLVSGGGGNDYASGGAGNDTLDGNDGDDRLYGGAGNDLISGHAGSDLLSGGDNDDRLYGASGSDVLLGGDGADQIDGGDGNDLLVSGMVAGETSSRTSVGNTTTFNPATYTNGLDNDAALLTLLAQWVATNDSSSIGAITHDLDNDDLMGGTGDDDFCWEAIDVSPGLAPSDFNAMGMGADQRIPPNA
jgi:autotransporter-associated beta strand protein